MVERHEGYGLNWILVAMPPISARLYPPQGIQDLMVEVTSCMVYARDSCGQEADGKCFTHHICPHHNCIVVWLDG